MSKKNEWPHFEMLVTPSSKESLAALCLVVLDRNVFQFFPPENCEWHAVEEMVNTWLLM